MKVFLLYFIFAWLVIYCGRRSVYSAEQELMYARSQYELSHTESSKHRFIEATRQFYGMSLTDGEYIEHALRVDALISKNRDNINRNSNQ